MDNKQKKDLILKFMNGPLRQYLEGEVSFGRFKELINEECGTDFSYGELYPSYLFNAQISYPAEDEQAAAYSQKLKECHAYGLCISGNTPKFICGNCPTLINPENYIPPQLKGDKIDYRKLFDVVIDLDKPLKQEEKE